MSNSVGVVQQVAGLDDKPVASPCVSICYLDDDDVCQGCFRTGREISDWGSLTNAEKKQVMELVRAREKASFNFIG
jgi:predicted Fe-S protein YdhL (DUF1289 family)